MTPTVMTERVRFHVLAPGKTLVFGQAYAEVVMGALLHKPGVGTLHNDTVLSSWQ